MTPRPPSRDADDPRSLWRRGEDAAAQLLRRSGFRILARNLRTREGEVDILARRGRLLIAAEVKARRDHEAPERTIRPAQLDRLTRALRALARITRPAPSVLRVDVVAVRAPTVDTTLEVCHFPGEPVHLDPP